MNSEENKRSKLVSLCTIAKNCADILPTYFNWATCNFSEINIVYDESEDDTKEILFDWYHSQNGHGYKIYMQQSVFKDFSSQKSKALRMAKKKWILLIDSDEIAEEVDWDKIVEAADRLNYDAICLDRYNLQKDFNHYKIPGPEKIIRLIRKEIAEMDGKEVDESIRTDKIKRLLISPYSIIHFGHVRSEQALLLKGKDRIAFADSDPCDGPGLKKHKEKWFIDRNKIWNSNVSLVPNSIKDAIERYFEKKKD